MKTTIGAISNVVAGGTPSTKVREYWQNGTIPWMRSGEVNLRRIYDVEGRITELGLGNSNATLIPQDSILVALAGQGKTRGTVAINKISLTTNQSVAAIIPDKEIVDIEYLFFDLDRRYNELRRLSTGDGGRGGLNISLIQSISLLLPPLPEQRKIAEILGTWDEAIRLTADLIAAKQQRKKGLMQRLLTGAVRFPQFKASNWKTENVGDLVTPISRNEKIDKDKTYRLIGVRWYLAGAHIHSEIRGNMIEATSLSRIEAGDILYNKMWVTKSAFAVAKQEHIGCYGTSEYPQFQAKKQFLLPEFIEYAFNNPKFLHDATTLCRGTTGRARLNPTDFLKLELLLPPVAEQREIASFLQACDHEIDLLQQKHAALQQQKKGLMQRLLTGQVRVKV